MSIRTKYPLMKLKLTLLLLAACCTASFAQNRPVDMEIGLGYGQITSEQLLDGTYVGLLVPTMRQYINTFSSGILSLQYKYYISNRCTIGFFAGVEQQSGDWYYDDMSGHSDDWGTFRLGSFSRTAFTIAPEFSFAYLNKKNVRLYSSVGMGATFKKEQDIYEPALYNYYSLYAPNTSIPVAETRVSNNVMKFNAYYSPLGVRFNLGGHINGFLEAGFGYKGIFNGGISYSLENKAVRRVKPEDASLADFVLLPHNFPSDPDWIYKGKISSQIHAQADNAYFDSSVSDVIRQAKRKDANVFRLNNIYIGHHHNRYQLNGVALYTDNIAKLKMQIQANDSVRYTQEPCAYIIIYLRENEGHRVRISINDDEEVTLQSRACLTYRLTKEGMNKIATRKNGAINIDAKFGQTYYVRAYIAHMKTNVMQVDSLKGILESGSAIRKIFIGGNNQQK